jgi:RNA polymerase-interacting CarD/CdnL/TRCF family regulator
MTEAQKALSLAVGDRVVYPNQGLCKVTGVQAMEIAGQKHSFFLLQPEEDLSSTIRVPQAKVSSIGIRKVGDEREVQSVIAFLKSDSDKASLDWKARARTNVERMAIGGLLGLAEVVKGLQVLSELRPLPPKERGLYNDARHLLVTEMAAALNLPTCDAEDLMDVVLFPPGKERPKRTAEEFRVIGTDDELGIGDDLLGLDGDIPLEEGEEAQPTAEDASAEASDEGEEGEEKPKAVASAPAKKAKAAGPAAKPPKAAKALKAVASVAPAHVAPAHAPARAAPAAKKPKELPAKKAAPVAKAAVHAKPVSAAKAVPKAVAHKAAAPAKKKPAAKKKK